MADLSPAHPGEELFRAVRASARQGIGLLVVDPAHGEPSAQVIPGMALIGHDLGARGNAVANEGKRIEWVVSKPPDRKPGLVSRGDTRYN